MTANELDVHVGQRIRQRREALGISQGRLARHLGLTFSQVQKYEKGANRIGAGRLFLIAHFLEVPIEYFFEEIAEPGESRSGGSGGQNVPKVAELAALDDAFLSIKDIETRRSVLSLICSLATSAAPEPIRPRRGIA